MPKRKAYSGQKGRKGAPKKVRTKKASMTKATNVLTLGGRNRIMPEVYHNVMEVMDTSNTVLGTGGQLFNSADYTLNGLYDYTTSVGNANVPGFSVLSGIYRNYRVKGVRFTMTAVNNQLNPNFMQISVQPQNNTMFTTWTNVRQLSSNKWSKTKLLARQGGADKGVLSLYIPFNEYAGIAYKTDEDYVGHTGSSGTIGGNPPNTIIGKAYALSADGATAVGASAMTFSVNIIYYVEWYGLVPVS